MFEFFDFLENPEQYQVTWRDGELLIARIDQPEPGDSEG